MSIVASDQTHRIRMAFTNGACKMSVQTPDLGEAQEELAVAYEGDSLEIGFNARTCWRSSSTCRPTRCA